MLDATQLNQSNALDSDTNSRDTQSMWIKEGITPTSLISV
jgi:hypothetical protein